MNCAWAAIQNDDKEEKVICTNAASPGFFKEIKENKTCEEWNNIKV